MREFKKSLQNAYRNSARPCAVRGVSPERYRVSLPSLLKN
jgi:hypothetical protein